MDPDEIIAEIIERVEHIFGDDGFGGTREEYKWLLENYGITEEEDNTWIDIIDEEGAKALDPDDDDDAKIILFLRDPEAVWTFLEALLLKYRSNTTTYPRPS